MRAGETNETNRQETAQVHRQSRVVSFHFTLSRDRETNAAT
jgi:hypothetical protein